MDMIYDRTTLDTCKLNAKVNVDFDRKDEVENRKKLERRYVNLPFYVFLLTQWEKL